MEFREITLQDRDWMRQLLGYSDNRATEFNFTVLFIWRGIMHSKVCRAGDFFVVKFHPKGAPAPMYFYPAGRGTQQQLKQLLEECMADARENGFPFQMASVQSEQKEVIESLFPDKFSFEPNRDYFDYIYSAEDLTFLRGKKFQSKRNFISRFKKQEGWSYEPVGEENLKECGIMSIKWCAKYGCGKNPSMSSESCSVKNAIENFTELGLCGGLLRLNGEVVAFTLAEKTNSDIETNEKPGRDEMGRIRHFCHIYFANSRKKCIFVNVKCTLEACKFNFRVCWRPYSEHISICLSTWESLSVVH